MKQERFDRSSLRLRPLSERTHDMTVSDVLPLDAPLPRFEHPDLPKLADQMVQARRAEREVIVLMGAHVIKQGLSRFVIDLMQRGVITCLGMNGACVIHDYELARVGGTTESVARYIRTGEFGLWQETGEINDIVNAAGPEKGFGAAIGEAIARQALPAFTGCHRERSEGARLSDCVPFPHADVSLLAAAHRLGLPATVHVGIGYDIIHEHPNFDGAKTGAASYHDFLTFAEHIRRLEGGVFLCLGSAVMGPEVYLKALAMARNVERQEGREIRRITTAVFDLADLGDDIHQEPRKTDARYYFRPLKTVLIRTVADGGESLYIRGDMQATLPALHRAVIARIGQSA
jgi:hypothetical protein